jgi:hypothetical protein
MQAVAAAVEAWADGVMVVVAVAEVEAEKAVAMASELEVENTEEEAAAAAILSRRCLPPRRKLKASTGCWRTAQHRTWTC